jgi:hypothetical protein
MLYQKYGHAAHAVGDMCVILLLMDGATRIRRHQAASLHMVIDIEA